MSKISRITALLISAWAGPGLAQSDMDMTVFYWDQARDVTISLNTFNHELDGTRYTAVGWSYFDGQFLSCYIQDSTVNVQPNASSGSVDINVDSTNNANWRCTDNTPPSFRIAVNCTSDGMNSSRGTGQNRRKFEGSPAVARYRERYFSNTADCRLVVNGDDPVTTKGWMFYKKSRQIK